MKRTTQQRGRVAAASAVALVAIGGSAWLAGGVPLGPLACAVPAERASLNPITGRVTLSGIDLRLPDGWRVRVGSASFHTGFALIGPAHAAENVDLKNVSIDATGLLFRIPVVTIAGSSLTAKDFASFIEPGADGKFAPRVASFAAQTITMPELSFDRTVDGNKQTVTFRNLVVRGIDKGKAQRITADGGTIKGPPPVDATFGAVESQTFDLALLARRLTASSPAETRPSQLYASFTAGAFNFKGSNGEVVSIKRVASTNAMLQPGTKNELLLTSFGQLKASEAAIDIPAKGPGGRMTRWQLKDLTAAAESPSDGIPTRLRFTFDGLTAPLTDGVSPETAKNLTDLGLTDLAFSGGAEAEWSPQASEFTVRRVTFDAGNLGLIELGGTFGKFGREVFQAGPRDQRFKDLTIRSMDLRIENKGLYERVVMREAKRKGKSIEQMGMELRIATQLYMSTILSQIPDSGPVLLAVAKFAEKPGRLTVNAKAKAPAGVPLAEVGTSKANPATTVARFDVKANAE